jgi:RsiW-degrading membrane proteinase PrsW (M82 family)
MSFDEYLYFIALIGCLVLFYFRGRLQNQSIRTKILSVLSMVIISIVPIVNIVAFVVILFDWFFESQDEKELTKKRPF